MLNTGAFDPAAEICAHFKHPDIEEARTMFRPVPKRFLGSFVG